MASALESREAKQRTNNASMTNGTSTISKVGSNSASVPSLSTDALAGHQATLEKTMQELAQVSHFLHILIELQEDVSHVKSAQAKTSMDITAIYDRLDEADGRIMDMETENTRLTTELQKRAKCYDELERFLQNAENSDRQLNLWLIGLKESDGENLKEIASQLIDNALGVKLADNELQLIVSCVSTGNTIDRLRNRKCCLTLLNMLQST